MSNDNTRRDFLKTAAVAGTTLAANMSLLANVHAEGSDTIRVGLIGCGGRGSGAAENVLHAAPNIKLVAAGDVFEDRVKALRGRITEAAANDDRIKQLGNAVDLPEDRCFAGFDAYKKVIENADYIMLATPPGFRPTHIEAVVNAGKNLFTEKPVGTDAPGIRKVLAAYETANQKKVCVVAGTQRRHEAVYLEMLKRVHEGALGEITGGRGYWNQGNIWAHGRQRNWTDMEYMLRNWYHFTWLCGDHIVEQHVHNLDVMNWAIGHHPLAAVGMGGRQVNTGPEYGESFDHFAVDYEYPNGVHVLSMCRQINGCENDVSEAVTGSKGHALFNKGGFHFFIGGARLSFHGNGVDPYVQEHTDLIAHIRAGKHINELRNVAESTLTAILGRTSAYTGKRVTWERMLSSKTSLAPAEISWDTKMPPLHIPVPGQTRLA
jgi:predicted dehydrogenase